MTRLRRCSTSGLAEGDVLRALPQHPASELAQVLVSLDDRREVVSREWTRLGGEAHVAVGEQDLRLGDAARVEDDLAGVGVARRVLRAEPEVEVEPDVEVELMSCAGAG